jgi:hypothetical protein
MFAALGLATALAAGSFALAGAAHAQTAATVLNQPG